MLGEVPIRVTVPPSSEPNDIGISRREGEVPVRRATCRATGIIIARAPTFLVTIERRVVTITSTGTWTDSRVRRGRIGCSARSTTPERCTAALTTRAPAMMITISLEKPVKALSAGTTPTSTEASSTASATRS